ncbi:histone deacetylase domain-containing protein [Colletotrichum graminicola]|uniref:Histone deacetylase domain-containing protein n=1 Tax=Colletotrichum graminicola (strain M1.001 / M2 / FGSC 10212) TaxID=645133 RepID=E3QI97_COLGM|nr:histone deacetylase domain-containing protein [Colletotrichum graminicola M1.001]EFQ30712.1 histone deacetylase domain-containing protein [Colletotrichum graminicola M1.001]WDK21459.1 histone deacetylase domain-containing protein [Colletotrichum graminicola]
MASPLNRTPSRRQSMLNTHNDGDKDLAHSLKQLSLSASPAGNSPRTSSVLSPLRPAVNRNSPAPSPRVPSRSPSFVRELSRSRSSTPTLQRSSTPTLQRKTSTSSLHSVAGSSSRTPSRAPSRRTSMAHTSSPSIKSPLRPSLPEYIKPPPTANSIARDYFKTELDVHHSPTSTRPTEALVVLHDACYGHRFSRPKTSRAALSTIVERPERIKAGVLGVAMAYVRLGERHCDGAYALHPSLDPLSIPTIPFRIYKTDRRLPLTSPAVTNVHGTKWMEELKMMCDVAEMKLATGGKELQRPEMNRGSEGPPAKFHEGDLYLCSESLEAFEGALGAVCEAVDRVFTSGPRRAFVAVRPPGHHCSASYPSGFCWINNVHVGIMHSILNHGLTHAAIIDFDLHHGDGSQAITWAHNARGVNAAKNTAAWKKASIGYFSLHDINSYPCEMGDEEKVKNASLCIDNAHGQNVYNVHLESYGSEKEFWELYESRYSVILEKTRKYLKTQAARLSSFNLPPKAAIFFSAGFDASEWETKGMQRHNVNVPTEFYARIAQDVVKIASEEGLGVDGRVISVLEGGYSDRALYSGIFSHLSGLSGNQISEEPTRGRSSFGHETGQKAGATYNGQSIPQSPSTSSLHPYNPAWWSSSELDELEVAMGNRPPSPRAVRHSTPPTYCTPTQASIGKAVDPARMRRIASGLSNGITYARPPTPPPPDVHWTVAAHELSRLLIPSDRQVDSCKPEDLNAEATRARRDMQSILNPDLVPPAPAPALAPVSRPTSRMSLRERKPTKPGMYVDADEDDDKRSKNRRKTVAGPPALSSDKAAARGITSDTNGAAKRPGRRLSAVSPVASNASEMVQGANRVAGPRPDTSMSVRPDSAMSVRTQGGSSLTVKKTRMPAAKKDVPKTTRTVKKPTAPAKPSPPQQSQPFRAPHRKPSPAAASEDDMDKLTAGMKKIKINLITKTQKEERAKAAQAKAATPPAAAEANFSLGEIATPPASSPVAHPTVTPPQEEAFTTPPAQPPAFEERSLPAAPTAWPEVSTPVTEQMPVAVTPDPRQFELPASSPVTSPAVATPSGSDVFINYQPEGPAAVSITPQEPLKWLPPNTNTPVKTSPPKPSPVTSLPNKKSPAKMARADLPVFSSTSAIPFASQKLSGMPEVKQEPAKSVREIPETPQK